MRQHYYDVIVSIIGMTVKMEKQTQMFQNY